MDPRLLRAYERELRHVREMGGEFAREFPKIAGRLGLDAFECADPYVERLLEGFAFLAARVQLKLESEFPHFIQHMLELLYPSYLAPTPSMLVAELQPHGREGSLTEGYLVARNTSLRSRVGSRDPSPCEFRTAHDVQLWPITLTQADYTTVPRELLDSDRVAMPPAKAALRIRLQTLGNARFDQLPLDRLPLFLRGGDETAMQLYEQLMSAVVGIVARPVAQPAPWHEVIDGPCVAPVGFDDEHALLPTGTRGFHGHRLLHEYFTFPARFMFAELRQLSRAVRRCTGPALELIVLFDRADARLEGVIDRSHLALFCTPAVNLFARAADRIHLSDSQAEYHVVPDRTRPLDLEVHSVSQVLGYGTHSDAEQTFVPLYGLDSRSSPDRERGCYVIRRQPRLPSSRERARGARSSYVGSETFISLVDGSQGPFRHGLRQLGISTLCTNRDLPLQMSLGQGLTDFTLQTGAPVESVRCVAGPTPPRASHAHGTMAWRLLSHLSLNHLSLVSDGRGEGASTLRELLGLYADLSDPSTAKQVRGVVEVHTRDVVRPLPGPGPLSFGRGLEVQLHCDEVAFEGSGIFLLGAVLERFFSRYASINSFSETVLHTQQRGEVMRWPTTAGRRHIL